MWLSQLVAMERNVFSCCPRIHEALLRSVQNQKDFSLNTVSNFAKIPPRMELLVDFKKLDIWAQGLPVLTVGITSPWQAVSTGDEDSLHLMPGMRLMFQDNNFFLLPFIMCFRSKAYVSPDADTGRGLF